MVDEKKVVAKPVPKPNEGGRSFRFGRRIVIRVKR